MPLNAGDVAPALALPSTRGHVALDDLISESTAQAAITEDQRDQPAHDCREHL